MSPEREKEFGELSAYVNFYMTYVEGIDPSNPVHPGNVGAEIIRRHGKSKALIGLRQATNDTLEILSDRPAEYVQVLDDALLAAGIPSISELRRRYAASYQRVLRREKIENETEYYLVKGIVVDLTSRLADHERSLLQAMLNAYEQNG